MTDAGFEKVQALAVYAEHAERIRAAEKVLADLRKQASDYAETIIDKYDVGPHGIMVDGAAYAVTFKRAAKRVTATFTPLDKLKRDFEAMQAAE